jgi:hypothetical protein
MTTLFSAPKVAVTRSPPSLRLTLLVFLVCGPFFIGGALVIVSFAAGNGLWGGFELTDAPAYAGKAALILLAGAVFWLIALLLADQGWMFTLLPTASAAVLYWVAAHQLVRRGFVRELSCIRAVLISVLLASSVSTPVFMVTWAARSWLTNLVSSAYRPDLVSIVAVCAVLVGLVLGLFWRRQLP